MSYRTVNLRCEYLHNPLAIETPHPRLSWEGKTSRQGAAQSAYRILVDSDPNHLAKDHGRLWDTGRVASSKSFQIAYKGVPLQSHQQVFWKVMIWDENQKPGRWSTTAQWTAGIREDRDWSAQWIGHPLQARVDCPLLRREFHTYNTKPKRALVYVSALGLIRLTINGKAVSSDVFTPGWTDYHKRRYYHCYDVTRLLGAGTDHCLGAELAEGWYKGQLGWNGKTQHYGEHLAALVQLRIDYEDGRTQTVCSDQHWRATFGPTVQASLYHGETHDAQLSPEGWDRAGFDDSGWACATVIAAARQGIKNRPPVLLQPYPAEPVRRTQTLAPVDCWEVKPGKVIYDFGQNIAGRVRLSFKGAAGTVIRLRFGEMVNPDKTLYVENLRSAQATDTYVMRGGRRETWEPAFTFHGFRYAEISGAPEPPSLKHVVAVVLGSDTQRTGDFSCSNAMINQLYSNAVWTQRANFLEVPTDCPQRDERLGWSGDAQVFIRTAICNMDVAAFFTKWLRDVTDAQLKSGAFSNVAPDVLHDSGIAPGDAAWGDAGVICPWTLFQCYEDRRLLETMFPHMQAWVNYLEKTSRKLLRGPEITHCFGDWLSINADTPTGVIQTAYFAHAVDITARAAKVLGKTAQAKRLQKRFQEIRQAFNLAFVKKDGTVEGNTQTAYLVALKFGLLDANMVPKSAAKLVSDIRAKKTHLSTGFVGTSLLMSVLRDTGHCDVAYKLLEKTTFPSWGYSVVNGATTIWERWNGWIKNQGPGDVSMNSYSHYAYGAVVEWLFDSVAGIRHGYIGFQDFVLCPQPGGTLKHADATFHSPYGCIRSGWRKQGRKIYWNIVIPPNTRAHIHLPIKPSATALLNGQALPPSQAKGTKDEPRLILPAGSYEFIW